MLGTEGQGETYWELEAELPPESEDLWSLFCYDRGALGAEVIQESPTKITLLYFFSQVSGVEITQDWPRDFSLEYPTVRVPFKISVSNKPWEPWETAWQSHFAPLAVGERIWIAPPWENSPTPEGRVRVVIDPGQGFGTGSHPSTALALLLVERTLTEAPPPPTMVDVGCGSGILALAAGKLGVPAPLALDVDGRALPETRRNFQLSGLHGPMGLIQGRPDCLRGRFPLVVANIVTPVLLQFKDELAGLTDPGGYLILSGILVEESAQVRESYAGMGLQPVDEQRRDEWTAFRLRRK